MKRDDERLFRTLTKIPRLNRKFEDFEKRISKFYPADDA